MRLPRPSAILEATNCRWFLDCAAVSAAVSVTTAVSVSNH